MKKNGIKLNLVMTYPVRWSVEHIMQDYVQNFYDALGAENFARDFVYLYDEERRELRMNYSSGGYKYWRKWQRTFFQICLFMTNCQNAGSL
ncbi:MAG: hypothetical protein NC489_38170 [Ruminococcus flavefaciens]|nr:hypothetical protein [Ruminococcus flavefaciens]